VVKASCLLTKLIDPLVIAVKRQSEAADAEFQGALRRVWLSRRNSCIAVGGHRSLITWDPFAVPIKRGGDRPPITKRTKRHEL
jgi:hypothetical protein